MSRPNFPLIKLEAVTVSFSRWGQRVAALDEVNLEVPAGQWLVLIGPNGSGKTTLMNTIAGRVLPDRGEIWLSGRRVCKIPRPQLADSVFQLHQDPLRGTAPLLTVFENLLLADPTSGLGVSRASLVERYKNLLEPLGLGERLRQPARTLSGGERQLLAFLIARLRPAPLVLLDEPFAALDPAKVELSLLVLSGLRAEGKTIIQVSHDPADATMGGDRTVALRGGRVVYDRSGVRDPAELKAQWFPVENALSWSKD